MTNEDTYECNCSLEDYSKFQRVATLLLVGLMIVLALFIMVNGLIDLAQD